MQPLIGCLVVVLCLATAAPAASQEVPRNGFFNCAPEAAPDAPLPGWMAAMPPPRPTSVTQTDVSIPSADGTFISARVYLPDAYAGPLPTALQHSPYWAFPIPAKEAEDTGFTDSADRWDICLAPFLLARGYAVVLSDARGTHQSGGCLDFGGRRDQEDGKAVVDWIAQQPWSNDAVGMWGYSFPGMLQYATAVAAPAALKAIIPVAAPSYHRVLRPGGTLAEGAAWFLAAPSGAGAFPNLTGGTSGAAGDLLRAATCAPSWAAAVVGGDGTKDAFWRERDHAAQAGRMQAAVLATGGTGDLNPIMAAVGEMWTALQRENVPRKLVVGPWGHEDPTTPHWLYTELRWFEHWLRGNDTGVMAEPRVDLFDQHGVQRTADRWETGRRLVLEAGAGTLTRRGADGTASYTDRPATPRAVLAHDESVRTVYTGEPLATAARVSGAGLLELTATIDTTDTNFVARLYDVAPDGVATPVTVGYLDARHRRGLEHPGADVTPGADLEYRIALDATEYTFPAGHRLQLMLSSSDSCPAQLCQQLGQPDGIVSDPTAATVTVAEGGRTRLVLPLAPDE